MPVSREGSEVMTRPACGGTSGPGSSSCGICEGLLSASDTHPENRWSAEVLD